MDDDIEIKEMEMTVDGWKCLIDAWIHVHSHEATASGVTGFASEQGRHNLETALQRTYEGVNAPLLIAWDKAEKKVAGFLINQLLHKDHNNSMESPGSLRGFSEHGWDETGQKQMDIYIDFWTKIEKAVNLFELNKVDKVFSLLLLSVLGSYQKRGIASRLISKGIDLAKEQGFTVVTANFASKYSQRIGFSLDFETVFELAYKDGYDNYETMPKEIADVHDNVLVMTKRL